VRIAIAGISHETNTYCRDQTPAGAFHQLRGKAMFRARGQESQLGGALAACDRLGLTPVPILAVGAQPSGIIERNTYAMFKREILHGLEREAPIDGVLLNLHGAGVVDGIEDLEGDLAAAVREVVGEGVPVVATFDLHGNVTQTMADALDGVFACHHYPHIDLHLRAEEAVELIVRMREENFRPVSHVETVPLLMPTTTTFQGPGKAMLEAMLEAEADRDVIDVSWFHGFPYTDTSIVGSHVVVTTREDRPAAERIGKRLAAHLWNARETFRPESLSAEQAITVALSQPGRPIVINETSDNCGGGTPGDGTHLLKAMLDAKLESACFGFIVDPDVASQAHEAGTGATINVDLGGKYDDLHGDTLNLTAYVKALHDGRLVMQAMAKGAPLNLGPMARLVVDGIDVIVASLRSQTFDPEPFLALGIDVTRYKIVALKSSNHFRAGFQDIAAGIVTADPPGLTTHQIQIFERTKALRPLWPIHADASYEEAVTSNTRSL
jgi:microcystin degradation protein MlrC